MRRLSPLATRASRENLEVIVGTTADVQRIPARGVRDADEAVADREGLCDRLAGEINNVKRAGREVACRRDRGLRSIWTHCNAERSIVDFDLHTRRRNHLTIWKQHAAVRLPSDERDRDECNDR